MHCVKKSFWHDLLKMQILSFTIWAKVAVSRWKVNEEEIKNALLKKALGYESDEIVEEYTTIWFVKWWNLQDVRQTTFARKTKAFATFKTKGERRKWRWKSVSISWNVTFMAVTTWQNTVSARKGLLGGNLFFVKPAWKRCLNVFQSSVCQSPLMHLLRQERTKRRIYERKNWRHCS